MPRRVKFVWLKKLSTYPDNHSLVEWGLGRRGRSERRDRTRFGVKSSLATHVAPKNAARLNTRKTVLDLNLVVPVLENRISYCGVRLRERESKLARKCSLSEKDAETPNPKRKCCLTGPAKIALELSAGRTTVSAPVVHKKIRTRA